MILFLTLAICVMQLDDLYAYSGKYILRSTMLLRRRTITVARYAYTIGQSVQGKSCLKVHTRSKDSALYPLRFLIDHWCLIGRFISQSLNAMDNTLYSLPTSQGFGVTPSSSLSLRQARRATCPHRLCDCMRLANSDREGVEASFGCAAAACVPTRTARSRGITPNAKSLSSHGS